jgi:hypothetical protein
MIPYPAITESSSHPHFLKLQLNITLRYKSQSSERSVTMRVSDKEEIVQMFLVSSTTTTCSTVLILSDLITMTILEEGYQCEALCSLIFFTDKINH